MFRVSEKQCTLLSTPLDRPPLLFPAERQPPLERLASCEMTQWKNCFSDTTNLSPEAWNLVTHIGHTCIITHFYCTKLLSLFKYRNRIYVTEMSVSLEISTSKHFVQITVLVPIFIWCPLVLLNITCTHIFAVVLTKKDQWVFIEPSQCWVLLSNLS